MALLCLQELLTTKSDDVLGRIKFTSQSSWVKTFQNQFPKALKLVKEMQSLCLNVEVLDLEGDQAEMQQMRMSSEPVALELTSPALNADPMKKMQPGKPLVQAGFDKDLGEI